MPAKIHHSQGRRLFANDVATYNSARPDYPAVIYQFIVDATGLKPNTRTLEVGAGNGLATRKLIELGARPMTLLEPDIRFAGALNSIAEANPQVTISHETFESWQPAAADFDLVTAATSFHWLDPRLRVKKLSQCLHSGGHVALWWNVFRSIENTYDSFHEATQSILSGLDKSPSHADKNTDFALDITARKDEFSRTKLFSELTCRFVSWEILLDSAQVRDLYSTFSPISCLAETQRSRVLDQLAEVAEIRFAGQVSRNMTTILYCAKKI